MKRRSPNWVLHDYLQVNGGAERLAITLANGLSGYNLGVSGIYPDFQVSRDYSDLHPFLMGHALLQTLPRIPRALAVFGSTCNAIREAECVIYSGLYTPLAVKNQSFGKRIYYCHTPPRFAFDLMHAYLQRVPKLLQPIVRTTILRYRKAYLHAIRQMDCVITNSHHIRKRLLVQTGISAEVVYPPIDTQQFRYLGQGNYYVSLGRLEPNKRIEKIIRAFRSMPDKRLIVASGGSDTNTLKALAQGFPNIEFTGWLNKEALTQLLGNAIAAIYIPKDEDFGMSAVEAMAAGKPVIGVDEGGLRESILDGETGLLLPPNPTVASLVEAVEYLSAERALAMRTSCERRAKDFSQDNFLNAFKALVP